MINAPAAVVPAYAGASVALAAPRVEYAGFWLRFFAYVIDNFILGAAVVLILIPVFFLTGLGALLSHIRPEEELGDAGAFVIVGFVFLALVASLLVTWLYHAMLESSQWQATVGKRMLGMVVTDTVGQRVSFGRATGRHFGKIITNMVPLFIGYIMAGFTEKKQALHDMLAGCFVLRRIS
jgi:uncharacterized RDD family membrane protein YckC